MNVFKVMKPLAGRPWRATGAAAALLALAVLAGCSSTPKDDDRSSVEKLYADAKDDMASGGWERAIKTLERVEGRAAGTLLAQQAMLDRLDHERAQGRTRNLLVAATGTCLFVQDVLVGRGRRPVADRSGSCGAIGRGARPGPGGRAGGGLMGKVIAVVETQLPDRDTRFSAPDEASHRIAGHLSVKIAETSVDDPVGLNYWRRGGDSDPRNAITLDHALRMATGRYSDTPGNRTDPLYFGGSSVDETAVNWPVVHKPGTVFRYANNDTLLAIKAIGVAARAEISTFLDRKVHLFLQVKVRENWQDEPERYSEMGLDFKDGN
mgnify:CR=1 FL=1